MAQRFITPNEQFYDGAGNPLAGGLLFFYASGTATPQSTFSDSGLTVANPNPVTLDSSGRAGSIFLGSNAYKVVLQDAAGDQIWTMDPVSSPPQSPIYLGGTTAGSANSQALVTVSPSGYSRQAGNIIEFIAGFTNTAGMTLNVASTGPVNVKKMSAVGPVALTGGEVIAGTATGVVDDGTQYVLISGYSEAGFATIASAATTNIGAAGNRYLQVTGGVTITAFDAMPAGVDRTLEFAGALTLTNGASLILPGGQNIITAAGDVARFIAEPSGVWRCASYSRAALAPDRSLGFQKFTAVGANTFTAPATTNVNTVYKITIVGGGGGGGGASGTGNVDAGGGASGSVAVFVGSGIAAGATVSITVGAAGSAGGAGTSGGAGGASSAVFNGVTITAPGGNGGSGATSGPAPGGAPGAIATNGVINSQGNAGGPGGSGNNAGGQGGPGPFGGGGFGGAAPTAGGGPGAGGGGGAAFNTSQGGASGAPGIVIVEWVQ